MRTLKFMTMASVLALALAAGSTARADVNAEETVDKTKTVTITIDINKRKDVDIDVLFDNDDMLSSAEAHAFTNQVVENSTVTASSLFTGNTGDPLNVVNDPFGIDLDALINGSMLSNKGFVAVNQDVGNQMNQGNAMSVAFVEGGGDNPATPNIVEGPGEAFTHAEAVADQLTTDGFSRLQGDFPLDANQQPDFVAAATPAEADKYALIDNSVNRNTGIVGLNQNAGNQSNQSNNIALAVGIGAVFALADAALGQETSNNTTEEFETIKIASINNSGNANTGIIGGNQNTGNQNNQGNSIAFSALTATAALTVPGQ